MNVVPFVHEGLGNSSYLVGLPGNEALLVDPDRNVDRYLRAADDRGWRITAVLETHLHADFISGTHELGARREVDEMRLFVPAGSVAEFPHQPMQAGRPYSVAGTLVAYAGVVLVVARDLGNPEATVLGDALMVCSAALLGSRLVYTSVASQHVEMPKLLMTQVVVGVVVFLALGATIESEPWRLTGQLALSVFYQGFVIAGFGFIANMWMLKHYMPSGVTALSLTTPVWGVIIAHFVLGDALGPSLFAGVGLVVAGMSYAHLATVRQQRRALRAAGTVTAK